MAKIELNEPVNITSASRLLRRDNLLTGVLLVLVMLFGGYVRFVGLNWDDFTHLHPDERFLTDVAASLGGYIRSSLSTPVEQQAQLDRCLALYPDSGGVGPYFDADCSTLNPHNVGKGLYVYGTLPLFMARGTGDLLVQLTGDLTLNTYNGVHLVWRGLSALGEMAVIFIVFLIGVQLHNRWVGLVAAALYAGAVLSIQLSHFGTADALANLFSTLAILFAVRVQTKGRLLDFALFGFALGAALASRINIAPLAGLVVLAAMMRSLPVLEPSLSVGERSRILAHYLLGLVIAGGLTIVVFRLANPYAFSGPGILGLIPNPRWLANMAEAQHLVSGSAEMPPNWQWASRTPYLFALNNIVIWGMGAALGFSALVGWGWSGWQLVKGRPGATRNLLLFVWFLVYFGWLGRNWVASMRYFLPVYPVLALLAAWLLVELIRRARGYRVRRVVAWGLAVGVVGFTTLWALMFTNIYRHQLTRVQASTWFWEQVPGDFAMRLEGAADDVPLINIAVANGVGDDILTQSSVHYDGQRFLQQFIAPADGTITQVLIPHLGDPQDDDTTEQVRVALENADSTLVLAEATLEADFRRDMHVLGNTYEIMLDPPVPVREGETYRFVFEVLSGGPVITGGSVVAHEGNWDDPIPYTVCTLPQGISLADDPPPGLLSAYECNGRNAWSALLVGSAMHMSYEDEAFKRDMMLRILQDSDYLTISSNRFYDTLNRIPSRWPMSNRYYEALFSGELGFEVAAVFDETFELGPLRVSDQYLPTYDAPAWLNEFEAEEAFHVYDHPAVFVFRKRADYDQAKVEAILNEAPLNRPNVAGVNPVDTCPEVFLRAGGGGCDTTLIDTVTMGALESSKAPTQLMFTEEQAAIQQANGSWNTRFDRSDILNQQPVLTVISWWLLIAGIGLLTWPLLFTMLPGLADRGYAVAKLAGMVLIAWLAWMGASVGLLTWSRYGLLALLGGIALLSMGLVLRSRAVFGVYVRQHWRRLLLIEGITLLAFVGFLAVRLTNPDLWHVSFGGEKPMDFAYFNGVLRSTVFPAIDPWYAGGFINYYYFGYVIVGGPVLLLGIVPSVAYNLIVPTLFAVTGIGAFAVAFNLVNAWQERRHTVFDTPGDIPERRRLGNPWIAGIMALLLAVVLGNLDTPRVLLNGLASLGGYQTPLGLADYLVNDYINTQNNGLPLDWQIENDLRLRAEQNVLSDRLRYEVNTAVSAVRAVVQGASNLLNGANLPVAAHRWYWAPTRIISETPGVEGNAINEMPYFTFLYGDLHAHMIAMPLLLFVMGSLLNEVLLAGRDKRRLLAQAGALGLGAVFVGVLRGTNTWDWPTFLLLSGVVLSLVWWLKWRAFHRDSVLDYGLRVGGFIAFTFVAALPYSTWYAATYGSLSAWTGGKTPLWAYLDIHGVFVFLVFCMLVWDTGRWFRSVYVRDLRGAWPLLISLLVALIAVGVGSVILAMADYQAALIAVPLLLWVLVLFLRPGQAREMQYVLVLTGLALGLTLGVEFVVLAGDIGRQNTVFKFYIQAWLLFSVVGGVAFAWLFEGSLQWWAGLRRLWYMGIALLIGVAALYPVMATSGRAQDRMVPDLGLTLDGMAYMQQTVYNENGVLLELGDDYEMIRWLQDNVDGAPNIIEAQSWREYLWSGRVAIYTGLPGVLGWRFHQTQQRTFESMVPLVNQRRANINGFYSTTDIETALRILRFYDVEYIIVGGLERAYYPTEGLAKFDAMVEQALLENVFTYGQSTVYRVTATGQGGN